MRHRTTINNWLWLFILCTALFLLSGLEERASGTVHIVYFFDPKCSSCEYISNQVLKPLLEKYGDAIQIDKRDITDEANFALMLALEERLEVPAGEIPEMFVGQDALVGAEEIALNLEERVEHYLQQGGAPSPLLMLTPTAPSATVSPRCTECKTIHQAARTAQASKAAPTIKPAIHLAFFFQVGCDVCDRSERDLAYIQKKYPQVVVHRFDVKKEPELNQYLCLKAGVPEEKHLTAPILFVDSKFLVGEAIRAPAIEKLIQPYLETGAPEPWTGWEKYKETARTKIVERFRSFGLLTVMGAGLLDGVNPCAFATIIFLISYLAIRKRERHELLATGAAFSLGVFFTYLGVGLGFLKFLASLPFLDVIGKWVYGLTMLLCLALAWGSFLDYRKAKEGRLEDMSLKLPDRLRGWIKTLIREGSGARNFVLSSFALGFAVSLVELACTGQVYLPTIIFMLGFPEWRTKATLALLLYNLMFILPLVVVFLLVYWGTTSEKLIEWMMKHTASVKLGTTILFVLLAGWLAYSLFAL